MNDVKSNFTKRDMSSRNSFRGRGAVVYESHDFKKEGNTGNQTRQDQEEDEETVFSPPERDSKQGS